MVKNVLVIDDSREFVNLATEILQNDGYVVHPALEALTAHKLAHELQPDLILLDIMMPGKSGWELLDMLKLDPETVSIPVIVTTAVRTSASRLQGKAFATLHKPFEIEDLLRLVHEAIGKADE